MTTKPRIRHRPLCREDAHLARRVSEGLGRDEAGLAGETEASIATTAANRVLRRHISAGEAGSVVHELPTHLRGLLIPEAMLDDG